jgi:hypothetical protein
MRITGYRIHAFALRERVMKITSDNRLTLALCLTLAGIAFSLVCYAADRPRGPIEPIGKTPLDIGWKAVTITGGLMRP